MGVGREQFSNQPNRGGWVDLKIVFFLGDEDMQTAEQRFLGPLDYPLWCKESSPKDFPQLDSRL